MKKLILLLSILSIVSCQKASHDYVEISGVISNLETDTLLIFGNDRYKKQIPVKKDGSFKDTLTIKDGFFALSNGKSQAFMNLKKGYELHVTADANDFEKSISFKGDGAGTNNYIAEKRRAQKEFEWTNLEAFFLLDKGDFDVKVLKLDAFNKKLLEEAKDLDSTFIANEETANQRMISFLKQNYTVQHLKLTTFAKGKPSPTFNLENYKGGKTSLTDLRGKYVYIDVWATWCAPCRQQIPALKKIEEDFKGKNIAFVSLSIDKQKDKAKWRKMIKNEKLGGIQLFAENDWESKFIKEYQITGIPRFILIDPKGNIVDANAPRPTDPKLLSLFNSLDL